MNKHVLALVLALSAGPALAFGGLSVPKMPAAPAGGGGATAADIERFLGSAKDADKLVGNAAIALVKAVGSKQANDKIQALLDAVKSMPEGAEKDAKVQELVSTAVNEASTMQYEGDKNVEMAVNDKAKKAEIGNSLKNLAIGSLVDADLLAQGKKLVSGIPSPDVADKLPKVKDALAAIGSQASGLGSILSSTKSLLTKVGIDALPTKATDKPADVSNAF